MFIAQPSLLRIKRMINTFPTIVPLYTATKLLNYDNAKIVFTFYSHNTNFGRLCLNVSTYGISG